jgi:hypothetical protein
MRHLTVPTIFLASSLIAGAAWAQTSSGGSSGGGAGGSGGGASSSGSSTGSTSSQGLSTAPSTTPSPPPNQGAQGSQGNGTTGNLGSTTGPVTGAPNTNRIQGNGGVNAGSETRQTPESTTGTVSGVNRQPGQPSAVQPTDRERKLFEEGEELEQKAREGLCQGCED